MECAGRAGRRRRFRIRQPLKSGVAAALCPRAPNCACHIAPVADNRATSFAMKRIFCLLGLALAISLPAAPFTFNKGDRISIIGNTLADRMQHSGWLETYIHAKNPKHELVFRNLAFPGDTITTRPRSANFGSADQWLTKMKTDVVFMFFGYNESFAGEAGLAKFKTSFKINNSKQM